MLRGAALSVAVGAVAFGILSVLPSGGPSVVDRAAAALDPQDDTILHYQVDAKQWNPDGSIVTWRSETWQLRVAPYTRRQIEVGSDGIRAESLTQGDTNELYDADNNTIYVASSAELRAAQMPRVEIVSEGEIDKLARGRRADMVYVVGKDGRRPVVVTTKQGAGRLRKRMADAGDATSGAAPEDFRSDILALLRSGRAQETGHVEVDGRDAIRIESSDGKEVYLVDATTYDPIEWTTTGDGGGVTQRFPVYEELPVGTGSMQLLDLEAQHPGARVVRDVGAYRDAESRLYPHG